MIWKDLGFKKDIFFVEPLTPRDEDIQLFVGRDEEVKRYLFDVLNHSRSLKIVSGDIGVGKTTFVNACQYYSYTGKTPFAFRFDIPRALPCLEKIQLKEKDDLEDFLTTTIRSVCHSIVHHCRLQSIDPPQKAKEILSFFLDMQIPSGGGGISGGINVMGTGMVLGKAGKSSIPNPLKNVRFHLKDLVNVIQKDLGLQGAFVIVNNLDILPKARMIALMDAGRDELFDIEGLYWTLIGRRGIGSIIETEAQRVADYLSGTELFIKPLDFPKIMQVIDKRVELFRLNDSAECPLTDEAIETFYFLSVQELRETLKICGQITGDVLLLDPSLVIPTEKAISAFFRYAHDRAKDLDLTESQKKVLQAVYDSEFCRPKDYRRFGYNSVQGFIMALKGLVKKKRLLSVEEKGRARIYRMTGMTMIAAATGALGEQIRDAALEKMRTNGTTNGIMSDRFSKSQLELELDENGQS